MPRWQPAARQRLVVAAVELFTEQGYDATTIAQITERAGLTKSTFFRHFTDKRELLVAGQETLSRLLTDGIADAPADLTPLEAVAAGLRSACTVMGPVNRELGPRLQAIIAVNAELRERDTAKDAGLATAIADALLARDTPEPVARIAAEIGLLAFTRGCATWFRQAGEQNEDLISLTLTALDELRDALTLLR